MQLDTSLHFQKDILKEIAFTSRSCKIKYGDRTSELRLHFFLNVADVCRARSPMFPGQFFANVLLQVDHGRRQEFIIRPLLELLELGP